MTVLTGGEVLVRSLSAHGVDTVFGIPGTHNLEIYRHLPGYGIRHITPRHEQGAGYAADGFARTSGRPAVAITTSGPAVLNIAAALGQAASDSVPVLVIAPGPARAHIAGSGTLHEMRDQFGALASVVRTAYRPSSHGDLTAAVGRSFVDMTAGRPGPVYLEVPLDLLVELAVVDIASPVVVAPAEPDATLMAQAVALLNAAHRPVLLLGGGARTGAHEALALAEVLDAPVLTTANGKGTVPEDHRLSAGAALHLPAVTELVTSADVVLAVGTELAETDWWNGLPPLPTLIRVDSDASQLHRNALAEVALHGAARRVLADLAASVKQDRHNFQEVVPKTDADSDNFLEVAAILDRIKEQATVEGARWRPWLDAIAGVLPRDAIVVADTAMACYYGALGNLPVYEPASFAYPTGFGTLGYAVPAALGAAIAQPERRVLALSGDGGLMFTVQELATVAAEGVALPVVVFVNNGYGEIRAQMHSAGIEPLGVDLPVPQLPALARALGGAGEVCTDPNQLAHELAAAWQRPGPTLLVVRED